ncbi:MAG: hypothetical protein JXL85_10125 [Bacilli bacterium]|nr:hypothetical protein [Bacilli bacterium]
MNKYIESEANQHVMKLIQMGADVKVVSGKLVYVQFDINEFVQVAYVYHLNKHNKFFLERTKPYPIPVREFDNADAICDIIKIDVEQFKNAAQSHNIREFIGINTEFHKMILTFEDLFLYYNVDHATVERIQKDIDDIHNRIKDAKESASRVYFGKEPDYLDD